MERRALGRSGLTVPVVGMGTWQTYDVPGADAAARQAVTDAALAAGASFFDSSPMYGQAERVLGRTLAARRSEAIVATKVWADDAVEAAEQIDAALGFFGGRVDVYQVHNLVAAARRVAELAELQARGIVRVIGLTHYTPSAFPELRRLMAIVVSAPSRFPTTRPSAPLKPRFCRRLPTLASVSSSCVRSARDGSPAAR